MHFFLHEHSLCLQAYSRHSLSRAALVTAGAPIFLLDTFTQLILYYTPGYPPALPFPPPHSTLLRKTVQALKQHRQVTPQVMMLRGMISAPCGPQLCHMSQDACACFVFAACWKLTAQISFWAKYYVLAAPDT